MFSVIIPLYNKENYIERTLISVLDQTFQDFEIIIVNDGSTDRSVEIITKYTDSRIKLVNQKNGGVSSARNRGISEAKFEWIAFLDADDVWINTKLEKVANTILDNINVEWLFSGFKSQKGLTTINRTFPYDGIFDDALLYLNKGLVIQTSTVVVKRSLFMNDNDLYFPIGINNSEDREVWYKLILKFPKPYYIPDALSIYMIDENGESLNTQKKHSISFLALASRLKSYLLNIDPKRKAFFLLFLHKYNRNACWNMWVSNGWRPDISNYISKKDQFIMKMFKNFPVFFKKVIARISTQF